MSDGEEKYDGNARQEVDHIQDLADGCGCAEVWEHLSERRASD